MDFLKLQIFLFPLAAALNFFSVTALLIISGFLGHAELAADIAITQGAIVAVFLSLSGNARNLILADSTDEDESDLFLFRLIIIVPIVVLVFFLVKVAVNIPLDLVVGLLTRRICEWFAELQLASREKRSDFKFASKYILINATGFLASVIALLFFSRENFYSILYIWGILPIVFVWSYIYWIWGVKKTKLGLKKFVPHMGSSAVIGSTTYIFRLLVTILAGKLLAGQMFAAYALGGVVSSMYTYALGPTLVMNKGAVHRKVLFGFVLSCMSIGIVILLLPSLGWFKGYSSLFMYGIGFSLIGGGVMLLAQQQRLIILQVAKGDVFVPDALANILLVATVPFAYYLLGNISFTLFFLWASILNLLFYMSLAYKSRRGFV